MRVKLLLIEDDLKLIEHLGESLRDQGFLVSPVSNRDELAEVIAAPLKVDFVVMDRLLGTVDTKPFMPELRRKWPDVPIVVLSAISTPNERTELLNLGADDYIGKPFSTQELVARIRALMRRTSAPVGNYVQVGNLILDSMKRIVSVGEKSAQLPTREFSLLRTLALDPSRIWSKDELLDYVWGQTADVDTNVVESTIANVRKRLSDLGADVSIRNLRNAGYWIAR